jgi:hypothetical protein
MNELVIRNWWAFILTLAVQPPQAIKLPAVINVLITGGMALFFLDGMDQVGLGQPGVILDSQPAGFGPDVFYGHAWSPLFCILSIFV